MGEEFGNYIDKREICMRRDKLNHTHKEFTEKCNPKWWLDLRLTRHLNRGRVKEKGTYKKTNDVLER